MGVVAVTELSGRSVLVTGASTGIGAAAVAALVERGWQVWAGVRRPGDAQRLRDDHGPAVTPLEFDVTDDGAVAEMGRRVVAAGPLHGVVNNAGVALPGPLEYLPLTTLRQQLDVNLVGQLAVTQAVLPAIRAGRGRVVMIGSIGGRLAGPMIGPYHASKFALAGLSDSLRTELAPWGIPVVLIEPGAVSTPIWERGQAAATEMADRLPGLAQERYARQIEQIRSRARLNAQRGIPAEKAAEAIVRALSDPNPRPRILVGRDAKVASVFARLPFRLQYRLTAARD